MHLKKICMLLCSAFIITAAQFIAGTPAFAAESIQSISYEVSEGSYLERQVIEQYTSTALWLAKNEIFARHGRMFSDGTLQKYFTSMEWYYPCYDADNFPSDSLNEFETANVQLLDEVINQKVQAGDNINRSSVENMLNTYNEPGCRIIDYTGLPLLAQKVSFHYKDIYTDYGEYQSDKGELTDQYVDNNRICGNIGFNTSTFYYNEGVRSALIGGVKYTERLIGSDTYSDTYTYSDIYGLSVNDDYNNMPIIARVASEHLDGGRGYADWFITPQAIYANNEEHLTSYTHEGSVNAVLDFEGSVIAEHNGTVYIIKDYYDLYAADAVSLGNVRLIMEGAGKAWPSATAAGEDFILCSDDSNVYAYYYDTQQKTVIESLKTDEYSSYAVYGNDIYKLCGSSPKTALYRYNSSGGWDEVCDISGNGYMTLKNMQGNILFASLGISGNVMRSYPHDLNEMDVVNSVDIAFDLKEHVVYILSASWYS